MRDLLLTITIFSLVPFCTFYPHVGVLVWSWLSYMNPHRLTWGYAYSMPFAEFVAIATLASLFISRDRLRFPITPLTVVWVLFILWMCFTTFLALIPYSAETYLIRVLKIQLITFITVMVIWNRERIMMLIWVIIGSIGFYSVKGGLFTLMSGGSGRVWGPKGTMIEENNTLGLATLITMPLMYYLFLHTNNKWLRAGLLSAFVLSLFSVLGSQSRGAIIAGTTVAAFFFLRSRRKFIVIALLAVLIPVGVNFMPDTWSNRIETIATNFSTDPIEASIRYNFTEPLLERDRLGWWPDDESAIGRVNAWNYAVNVAGARLTGGGFESWEPSTFSYYAPITDMIRSSHSIYFGVLADHGWIGLFLYLLIGFLAWRNAGAIISRYRGRDDLIWLSDLARTLQICLIAYASGGAFLGLAYFDLPWHIIALIVICRMIADDDTAKVAARSEPEPHPRAAEPVRPRHAPIPTGPPRPTRPTRPTRPPGPPRAPARNAPPLRRTPPRA